MIAALTKDVIETAIESLPLQNRVMIRLLLIQYVDLKQEDIEYMTTDRPDPRMQLSAKLTNQVLSRHAVESVATRVEQYQAQVRQKRERLWLQIECTKKQIALSESLCKVAEGLMSNRFGYDAESIQDLKKQARSAIPKPALRALNKQWDQDAITEEDYLKARLAIEYQTELRRLERVRRRFEIAKREFATVGNACLQDHEIAHIWGIPLSSLAARKVKTLHQYLTNLQNILQAENALGDPLAPPVDLWKETFATLAEGQVQRSIATYDGMEGSEAALLDKLTAFVQATLSEDEESRFWQIASRDYSPNAIEGQGKRQSLFALQRLAAILSDIDPSLDALEQELLTKIAPKSKVLLDQEEESSAPLPQLGDMAEHVLRSFRGEERS